MLNNDIFGARPKFKCTPIISVENTLHDAVEIHIQSGGQLQPCNPYPLKTIKPELDSLVNKLEHLPRKDWSTAKLTDQEVQIHFRKTIREWRKIFWLMILLLGNIIQEEVVWQANKASAQNNLSVRSQESTDRASLLCQSQGLNIIENQLVQPKESNNLANTSTRRRRSRRNRRSARDNQSKRDEIQERDFSVEDSIVRDYTRGDSLIIQGPITQSEIDTLNWTNRDRFYARLGFPPSP